MALSKGRFSKLKREFRKGWRATEVSLNIRVRLWHVMPNRSSCNRRNHGRRSMRSPCCTMIVLGSGGHTMEMFGWLQALSSQRYSPRIYILASSDTMSLSKVKAFERRFESMDDVDGVVHNHNVYDVRYIPRCREVGQSFISSIWSTIIALMKCIPLMLYMRPDVLLCNGPGTCLPVCIAAYVSRMLGWKFVKVVYIESVARVRGLSLAGRLIAPFADRLLVQWPSLANRIASAEYIGTVL